MRREPRYRLARGGSGAVVSAGSDRCYVLTDDLTDEQLRLAAAMCLCSREVRAGRLEGPFTTELAERWADVFLSLDP